MARVRTIKIEDVVPNLEYERPMVHRTGVSPAMGAESIGMTRGTLPPGKRIRAHYHINAEMALYIISGYGKIVFGMPGYDAREEDLEPGVFVYMPRGEIHYLVNTSDTEPLELVGSYNRPGPSGAGTVVIEPPLE